MELLVILTSTDKLTGKLILNTGFEEIIISDVERSVLIKIHTI
jgi:hypothetical protein